MAALGNPGTAPEAVVQEATVAHNEARSPNHFLLRGQSLAIRLASVSNLGNHAVILDHQVPVALQLQSETPIRRYQKLSWRHDLIGWQY